MVDLIKIENTGYAPLLSHSDVKHFSIKIQHPLTHKIEIVPLCDILHVFTEREILEKFTSTEENRVFYTLTLNCGSYVVNNWKYALRGLLKIED